MDAFPKIYWEKDTKSPLPTYLDESGPKSQQVLPQPGGQDSQSSRLGCLSRQAILTAVFLLVGPLLLHLPPLEEELDYKTPNLEGALEQGQPIILFECLFEVRSYNCKFLAGVHTATQTPMDGCYLGVKSAYLKYKLSPLDKLLPTIVRLCSLC